MEAIEDHADFPAVVDALRRTLQAEPSLEKARFHRELKRAEKRLAKSTGSRPVDVRRAALVRMSGS